jgi:hypothetical protein
LFVGVAIVAASALVGAMLLRGDDTGARVWAARTPLAEGQTVTQDDLVRRVVGFTEQADANRYLTGDQPLPEDATLTREVGEGELLPRTAVVTGAEAGLVRVPLAVLPEAVPATTGVGSIVDVWVVPDPAAVSGRTVHPAEEEAVRVLSGVPVLHMSRGSGPLGASAVRQVVVGLGPDRQEVLPGALAAIAAGSVVLTSAL